MARPKTPILSVDRIVNTALSMVGRTGSFTMTELAAKLHVRQSSLYNHVRGHEEVVELIRQRLHEEMSVQVNMSSSWQDSVREFARAQRDSLARYPWLVPLLATSPAEPGGAASSVEDLATVLVQAGFADDEILQIMAMIDMVVIGASLDLASPEQLYPREVLESSAGLARAVAAAPKGRPRAEAGFDFTLDLIIGALERRLADSAMTEAAVGPVAGDPGQ